MIAHGQKKHILAKEIALALLVKVMVIYALWSAFFSQPLDDNLTGRDVGHAFLGASVEAPDMSSNPRANINRESKGESR